MNIKENKLVVGYLEENCYFITKKNTLIIDPGDESDRILNYIKENNLNVVGILITHAHFDHIGALDDILDNYKVPVYYYNKNKEINYENLINLEEKNYEIDEFKFNAIYTPGHRNDHMCFDFYEENIMFTGDFIFKGTIGRTDLEFGNMDDMKDSIKKIKNYNDDYILYPGHGEDTSLKYEKENNMFLND